MKHFNVAAISFWIAYVEDKTRLNSLVQVKTITLLKTRKWNGEHKTLGIDSIKVLLRLAKMARVWSFLPRRCTENF